MLSNMTAWCVFYLNLCLLVERKTRAAAANPAEGNQAPETDNKDAKPLDQNNEDKQPGKEKKEDKTEETPKPAALPKSMTENEFNVRVVLVCVCISVYT